MKTVKDLLERYQETGDIDVYDDYDERIGIAYCGTQLTNKGRERFEEVLDFPISADDNCVVILTDYDED